MSLSVDNIYSSMLSGASADSTSSLLSASRTLENLSSSGTLKTSLEGAETDDELYNACKEFEAYFVEKIFKSMKETVATDEEEEGEYMSMFGDMLTKEYATSAVETGGIGLAKQLYESMKRNMPSTVSTSTETSSESV